MADSPIPKHVEPFIRIAAVFVSFSVVLTYVLGDPNAPMMERILQALLITAPITILLVIGTVAYQRRRANPTPAPERQAENASEPTFREH